jgi:hypothetical protein
MKKIKHGSVLFNKSFCVVVTEEEYEEGSYV